MVKDEPEIKNALTLVELPRIKAKAVNSSWSKLEETEKSYFCLKDLNFEINQNELIAIIGPVGSGKVKIIFLQQISSISANTIQYYR